MKVEKGELCGANWEDHSEFSWGKLKEGDSLQDVDLDEV
jgi:hypothetical protein